MNGETLCISCSHQEVCRYKEHYLDLVKLENEKDTVYQRYPSCENYSKKIENF